eukprot:g879.t1
MVLIQVNLSENNEIDFLVELQKGKPAVSSSPEPSEEVYARPQFSSIIERIERAYASGPIQSRKTRKRKRKSSDESGSSDVDENSREYDLNDPFIDDSEIIVQGGESLAPLERTGGKGFYVTKGNAALPPSSSESKNNSSEASSPVHSNENTSNNKNRRYVKKWLHSLSIEPSEDIKNALNRLRAVADSIEGNKIKIPREMDSILSEIEKLYLKESSRTTRSNSFYAMVMNCFEKIPSQRTLSKRFREIDLKNAEVEAKKKYHVANRAFMDWIETKVPKTATATADIFTDEGRSLLLDAILSRESYTLARNIVENATKSKNSANLIKPRTDSKTYLLSLLKLFPNSCVSIEELRKLRDQEKKRRQRIEEKKNKQKKTTGSSSSNKEVVQAVVRKSPSPSPTEMTSGPLRSFFYMDPPLFEPNDFVEEGFEEVSSS